MLPDALRERGVEVTEVALYETLPEPLDADLSAVDWITFTSASTVRFLGDIPAGPKLASKASGSMASRRVLWRDWIIANTCWPPARSTVAVDLPE